MQTRLQGIGMRKAIEAKDLKPGMVVAWNYGYSSEVIGVEFSKTGKTLVATLKSNETGSISNRKMAATRLVAMG